MIKVFLLSKSDIVWNSYLSLMKQTLGRSVTKELDNNFIDIKQNNLSAFIQTLGEIENPGTSPNQILVNSGDLLNHVFVSMILICSKDSLINVLSKAETNFLVQDSINTDFLVSIISGNLSQWRSTIINCSHELVSKNTADFANQCMLILNDLGFDKIFEQYVKIRTMDGAVRLLKQK